jgi:hypothetical protein
MLDDGVYCLALAEMALHKEGAAKYTLPHPENDISLRYYDQSVTHINEQMLCKASNKDNGPESLVPILVAVLGLASYDVNL